MHSENGALKHFSVCVFCVWLSQSNSLIWHISVQENNNIPACSFLIVVEKKRLQAIHRADGLLWHRLVLAQWGSTKRVKGFRWAAAQMDWQGSISWSCCCWRSRFWFPLWWRVDPFQPPTPPKAVLKASSTRDQRPAPKASAGSPGHKYEFHLERCRINSALKERNFSAPRRAVYLSSDFAELLKIQI